MKYGGFKFLNFSIREVSDVREIRQRIRNEVCQIFSGVKRVMYNQQSKMLILVLDLSITSPRS